MLIEFKPWHLEMMRLTAEVREVIGQFDSPAILGRLASAGLVFTIVGGDEPVILGVVGAVPIEGGDVAEVFIISAETRCKYRVEFVKSVKQALNEACKHFKRVDALESKTRAKWFLRLGFFLSAPGRWSMVGLRGVA